MIQFWKHWLSQNLSTLLTWNSFSMLPLTNMATCLNFSNNFYFLFESLIILYWQLRPELRRTRLKRVREAGMQGLLWQPAISTHYDLGAQPEIESVWFFPNLSLMFLPGSTYHQTMQHWRVCLLLAHQNGDSTPQNSVIRKLKHSIQTSNFDILGTAFRISEKTFDVFSPVDEQQNVQPILQNQNQQLAVLILFQPPC